MRGRRRWRELSHGARKSTAFRRQYVSHVRAAPTSLPALPGRQGAIARDGRFDQPSAGLRRHAARDGWSPIIPVRSARRRVARVASTRCRVAELAGDHDDARWSPGAGPALFVGRRQVPGRGDRGGRGERIAAPSGSLRERAACSAGPEGRPDGMAPGSPGDRALDRRIRPPRNPPFARRSGALAEWRLVGLLGAARSEAAPTSGVATLSPGTPTLTNGRAGGSSDWLRGPRASIERRPCSLPNGGTPAGPCSDRYSPQGPQKPASTARDHAATLVYHANRRGAALRLVPWKVRRRAHFRPRGAFQSAVIISARVRRNV